METIYSFLSVLLPFEWMDHIFMKNAFLAVLLVTPLFGLLSTMVVSNRMAFFSDSLGHGAFTGIAIGVLLGVISPLVSLVAFSIIFSLLITYIKSKSTASTDTIIGVFSSTAIAAGLMMMSYGGGFNKFSAYLIGDLLSITPEDLMALAGIDPPVAVDLEILNDAGDMARGQDLVDFARRHGLVAVRLEDVWQAWQNCGSAGAP